MKIDFIFFFQFKCTRRGHVQKTIHFKNNSRVYFFFVGHGWAYFSGLVSGKSKRMNQVFSDEIKYQAEHAYAGNDQISVYFVPE